MDTRKKKILNVTKEAHHRIVVGLSWNPSTGGVLGKVQELTGLGNIQHDLDLSCYLLSQNGQIIERVDHTRNHDSSSDGRVYHSGDNVDGYGSGDDEEISAELKDLSETITHLIFVARIEGEQNFYKVQSPQMRLADGYTGREFLSAKLDSDAESINDSYIFCCVSREPEDRWSVTYMNTYIQSQLLEEYILTSIGKE